MSEKVYRITSSEQLKRRREEIASLLLEDYSTAEIIEFSVYSKRTIERDVDYIKKHPEEFY